MPEPPLLSFSQVSKTYPGSHRPSLQNLTLDVGPREILGLVGLNGAGKTTAIRAAAGVIRLDAGSISVGGFDMLREKVEASRHLGWVSEYPNFDPVVSGRGIVRYFAGFRGIFDGEATRLASNLLDFVGLESSGDQRFRSLSQGTKKRLALAVAMIGDPEVMLLDEILNGLDPEGIALVRRLLLEWRSKGKAILLSSHLLGEVQQVADRVAVLHRGRLVRILSKQEISSHRSSVLRISVTDLDAGALAFLATKGAVRRDGVTVWLSQPTAGADEINIELSKRGYHVRELALESGRLEDLFFELIEEPVPGTDGDEASV